MNTRKVLVVGSGAREHAICHSLVETSSNVDVFCAPGNPGIQEIAECFDIKATDIVQLLALALRLKADLTVVGPEEPLMLGIVDVFQAASLRVFGPTRNAARIEWSKAYCKALLRYAGVPTADYRVFDHPYEARDYLLQDRWPIVIKPDGLTSGKGVVIAHSYDQAEQAIKAIMIERIWGAAGDRVVIEEFLTGQEMSFIVLAQGNAAIPLLPARDYKRLRDADQGPMTGGMGSFAPLHLHPADQMIIMERIVWPTLDALKRDNRKFVGAMYFDLMLMGEGVKVLEINCRFGDPETQVTFPLLQTDLYEVLVDFASPDPPGHYCLRWWNGCCVGVVIAVPGYPEYPWVGRKIKGIETAKALSWKVFHAGTEYNHASNSLRTSGGRVVTVVGVAETLENARVQAYKGAGHIEFEGGQHYRTDIAATGH